MSDLDKSSETFSRKWTFLVILFLIPVFFLFEFMGGPGKGRAAAASFGIISMAVKACWDMRKYVWFWAVAAVLIALHVFLVFRIPWTSKSYPGYTLLPFAMLDYGIMYGSFKLTEKLMRQNGDGGSSR
jgi:hypothetical protein